MKKQLLSILLIVLSVMLLLSSCKFGGKKDPEDKDDGTVTEEKENLIYDKNSELYVFVAEGVNEDLGFSVSSELDYVRDVPTSAAPMDSETKPHEIVIGNSGRAISAEALQRLEREKENKSSPDELIFLVYSNGSSLAVVWEEDSEGVMARLAIEYFIENYVKEELVLSSGVASREFINLLDDYYAVIDKEYKDAAWAEFEDAVGKELCDAYKQLYSLYESKTVVWLANLYDPDICVCVDYYGEEKCSGSRYCGGAGFYYSNSGRDNMGFLPDIESTTQAFSFLASSGMAYKYNNHYPNIVPEDMKAAVCKFFISLQEPNGYFYHPQWGVAFTDTKTSRRARDLNSATTILRVFGSQPIYDTPNGVEGSGVAPASFLTTKLGNSGALMVSKAVACADAYATHLQDVESFKNYLNGLEIENDSYAVGNELTSQNTQIIDRDKKIGTPDNPTPLMDTLINWLNYHQKENGAWDDKKPGDAGYKSAYYASNGLLKISGIYNAAGKVFPNAKVACETAFTATLCDSDVGSVVELYNTWYAIQVIVGTLRLYGDSEDDALADEIVSGLRERAVEGIRISREKDSVFFKADGSASYGVNHTSADSQGCPVAITGTNEGDVNATIIALTGIVKHSLAALELSEYEVPIFGEYERILFYKTIDGLSPITKKDEGEIPAAVDFESDEIGSQSDFVDIDHLDGNGTDQIIADPTGTGMGKVLKLTSYSGCGDYVKMRNDTVSGTAKVSVFEGDFYIVNATSSYSVQLLMENQYMLTFRTEGDTVRIVEVSSGDGSIALEEELSIPAKMQEWFRLKIEYYYDVHGKVRIKVYADADLSDSEGARLYAVTDNYYDPKGVKFPDKDGTPSKEYHGFSIYAMKGVGIEMYLDNLNCYKINKTYEPETDPNNQPPVNVDSPDRERIAYGFDDGQVPAGITVSGAGFATAIDGGLKLSSTSEGTGSIKIPVNVRTKTANCATATFSIHVPSATEGESYLRIKGTEGVWDIFGFVLKCPVGSGGNYLTLVPENEYLRDEIKDVKIPVGKTATVSLAYYHKEDAVLIYVDGEFMGATDVLYKDGFKRKMKELVISEIGSSGVNITLDNITVEKVVSSFDSAVSGGSAEKIFDFESEDTAVKTDGAGAKRTQNGDWEMRLDSSKGASSVFLPVNNRSKIYTAIIAETEFTVISAASDGQIATVSIEDNSGDAAVSFAVCVNGNKVEIKQVGVDGVLPYTVAQFPKGERVTLRFEAFTEEGAVVLYKNGEALCISPVFAAEDPTSSLISGLRVSGSSVKGTLALDNVKVETVYRILGSVDVKDRYNPETDLSSGLDFESSTLDSIPTAITSELRSIGSFVDVRRVFNSYRKNYSNILRFKTAAGGNDGLNISTTESLTAYKGVAFEADMRLDYTNGNPTHRITIFGDDKEKDAAYMMLMHVRDGKLVLEDTSNLDTDVGFENTINTGVEAGDWFNLRIEYYYGTRNSVRIKILINGETVAVSDNFRGKDISTAAPSSVIKSVNFYSMNATVCTIELDNLKICGLSQVCNDAVTATPK